MTAAAPSAKEALIRELVALYIEKGESPTSRKFRASHVANLDDLDALQNSQRLQRDPKDRYRVSVQDIRKSPFWEKERANANQVLARLKQLYNFSLEDTSKSSFTADEAHPTYHPQEHSLDSREYNRALRYLEEANLMHGTPGGEDGSYMWVTPHEAVLRYDDIEVKLKEDAEKHSNSSESQSTLRAFMGLNPATPLERAEDQAKDIPKTVHSTADVDELWKGIQTDYSIRKSGFAKRIGFVKDKYAREAILRDVAHSYGCLHAGFFKASAILAGGVIEELLRNYYQFKGHGTKGNFKDYIDACKEKGLIESDALKDLSHAVRGFRNFVHMEKESSKENAISKPMAQLSVSAIFALSGHFKR